MGSENKIKQVLLDILKEHDDLREEVSSLLLGISKNTGVLSEMSDILEPIVGSFLFEKDKQMNIIIKDGEPELYLSDLESDVRASHVIKQKEQSSKNPVLFNDKELKVINPGDIEIHSIFERRRLEDDKNVKHKVNELEACLSILGIPELQRMVAVITKLITKTSVKGFGLNAQDMHAAIHELLPKTAEVVKEIIDLENSQFHFEEGDGYIIATLSGYFNMKGLKETYPSLAEILQHVQHINVDLLEVGDKFENPPMGTDEEKVFLDFVANTCKGWCFSLDNRDGAPFYEAKYTLQQDGSTLLWNDAAGVPIVNKPLGIDIKQPQRFLILVEYALRIKELGCASISMPRLVLNLNFNPDNGKSQAEEKYNLLPGFHLTMHYFARQGFLARMIVRPFINVNLLRELMMMRFFVHIGIEKSLNFRTTLLPPPVVLSSCVKHFVRNHIKNQGDLLLYSNICRAVGEDLRNLAPVN